MSKNNKVNKDHYVQKGRLTADEMARERMRQTERSARAKGKERMTAKAEKPVKATTRAAGARGASRPRSAPEE
jgi:hypothetical protein